MTGRESLIAYLRSWRVFRKNGVVSVFPPSRTTPTVWLQWRGSRKRLRTRKGVLREMKKSS